MTLTNDESEWDSNVRQWKWDLYDILSHHHTQPFNNLKHRDLVDIKNHNDNDIANPKFKIHILQYITGHPDSEEAKESRDQMKRDCMARLNT